MKGQISGSQEFGIGSVKYEVLIERREEERRGGARVWDGTCKWDLCDVAMVATETRILCCVYRTRWKEHGVIPQAEGKMEWAGYRQRTGILRNIRNGWLCKQRSPYTQAGRLYTAFP